MLTLVASPRGTTYSPTQTLTVRNPRDGSIVGTLPTTTDEQIAAAISQAFVASPAWAAVSPTDRGRALRQMASSLEAAAEELAELNTLETGRATAGCREGVLAGVAALRFYAQLAPTHRRLSRRGPDTPVDFTVTAPRGVVVALTPWDQPVALATQLIGAAVATGNVVIHKPSEHCPHVGLRLGEILGEFLPRGVLTTVTGGAGVGSVLASAGGVDVIAHVGSSANGRRVSAAAARTGAHVIRGDGGNDALLIDAGVDAGWAGRQAAAGVFAHGAHLCWPVERLLVHEQVAEAFLTSLVDEARTLNAERSLAPMINEHARTELHRRVVAARHAGAVVLEGGFIPDGSGTHYPATVVTNCPLDSALMTEETFGPVASVHVVDDFENGLILAAIDGSARGATVLSGTDAHIETAISTLSVGRVTINTVRAGAMGDPAQPRGHSAIGYEHGPELLDELTSSRVVHVERAVLA